jgi:hypothetical protein
MDKKLEKLLTNVLTDVRVAKIRLTHCRCKTPKIKKKSPNPTPWEGRSLLEKLTEIEARVEDILVYVEDESDEG